MCNASRSIDLSAPEGGTIMMDKGDMAMTIYERLLVNDKSTGATAWSRMIQFGIKSGPSRK